MRCDAMQSNVPQQTQHNKTRIGIRREAAFDRQQRTGRGKETIMVLATNTTQNNTTRQNSSVQRMNLLVVSSRGC